MTVTRTVSSLAVAVVVFVAGCSAPGPDVTEDDGQAQPVETSTDAAAESGPPQGAHTYGSTATWPDGVAITLSRPEPFTPSETAQSDQDINRKARHSAFTVTVRNGSPEPVNAYAVGLTATSGDRDAARVIDSEQGVNGGSPARVLPGRSVRWREAWTDPAGDLAVTVDWNYAGEPVTFTGS